MEANHRRRPNSRKQNTGAARHGIKHGMTVEVRFLLKKSRFNGHLWQRMDYDSILFEYADFVLLILTLN